MKVAVLLPIYLGKAKTTLVAYGKWFETLVRLVKQNADLKTSTRPNVASFTKIAAPFQQVCRVYPRESRESATVSPGLHVIRRGYLYHFLHLSFSSWRPNANEVTRQRVIQVNSKPTLNFRMERQETTFNRMTSHSNNSSSSNRDPCGKAFLFECSSSG